MAGYNEITLAAWLHDIGIFSQRAGIGSGEQFLQSVKDCLPGDVQVTEVVRLVSAWRNPSAYDEWLIAHGDRLSKGNENLSREDTESYDKPLVHLVSTIQIGEKAPDGGYCSMEPLEGRAIFSSKDAKAGRQEYLGLWKDFEKDFRALKGLKYNDFIQSLDTLLERYCWCIPVSPQERDISLYQHLKMSAAFAGTLYLYHQDKNTPTKEVLDANDEKPFLFVQGDVSGIQKYIFDLKTTDNNAKLLRARSFQIWTLGELIAGYLCGQFGVSRENVITSAGAKFLLLAPNIHGAKEKLDGLRLEIESFFLREFAGKLAFVLSDGVPASGRDVQKGNLQKLINTIGRRGDEAKQKKMQAALKQYGHVLEKLYNSLQKNGECEYCETLPADHKTEDGKNICANCDDLIKIGGKLVKTEKIILKTEKLSRFDEMVLLLPKEDGQFGYLTGYTAGFPLMSLPYAAPKDAKNNLYTFEEIAEKASGGNKKLAMFKADIDNLGLIFTSPWSRGSEDKVSFSRYAQLSRQLHCFFTAFISGFIEGSDEYRDKIYTVFSGGDDLCVLGAWDAVMRFASDFQKELSAFTGGNPSVTVSGGIALAGPKLPVRAIAAMAEEALEQAKERRDKSRDEIVKNAVSVFGVTVSWDEYKQSLQDAEKIKYFMNKEIVSSAVVYKMIDFANRAREAKNGNLRDMLWMSNYRYIIARNIKAEHKEALEFFNQFGVSPDVMEKSRIAVSYALYINRKGKEE
jgi:CRISPR-associated protein Csm1